MFGWNGDRKTGQGQGNLTYLGCFATPQFTLRSRSPTSPRRRGHFNRNWLLRRVFAGTNVKRKELENVVQFLVLFVALC